MKYDPDTISKNIKRNEEIKKFFFVLIYIISVPIILFSIFLILIELGKNSNVPEFMNFEFYTAVQESDLNIMNDMYSEAKKKREASREAVTENVVDDKEGSVK